MASDSKARAGARFGRKLRSLREARGKSLTELAQLSRTDPGNLSAYEHGKNVPGFVVLVRLADALDVTLDEFRVIGQRRIA